MMLRYSSAWFGCLLVHHLVIAIRDSALLRPPMSGGSELPVPLAEGHREVEAEEETTSNTAAAASAPQHAGGGAGATLAVQRWDRFHPLFAAMKDDLLEHATLWDYAPYSPCPVETLELIHFFWVAAAAPTTIEAVADVAGVVGAVLCPVGAAGNGTDVYLQVVLVRPPFRRQGIGSHMMRRVLGDLSHQARGRLGGDAATRASPVLHRVRLHTMIDTPATKAFLLKSSNAGAATCGGGGSDANHEAAVGVGVPNDAVQRQLVHLQSVRRLYEGLGFSIRRNCPKYYDKSADGVEMVLERAALLRCFPAPSPAEGSGSKRSRE